MTLVHAPYAGRALPFSIGLRPIDEAAWIAPDEHAAHQLAQKATLLATERDVVLRHRADTSAVQQETLELISDHLARFHPAPERRDEGVSIAPPVADEPAIVRAAMLVQDDLVIMRREADGWRLVAACLCFPSTWSLAEKFDRPMEAIHADVPGYEGQMAQRINRIFDTLPAGQIVERFNWSIYGDNALHHPETRSARRPWAEDEASFETRGFVRVERQTLRRLPRAGDILFTIRIQLDPVAAFRRHPEGAALADALAGQLAALTQEQLAYKGMRPDRDLMLATLRRIAAGQP
jgi:hypothetical protein